MSNSEILKDFYALLGHTGHGITAVNIFDKQSGFKKKIYVSTPEEYAETIDEHSGKGQIYQSVNPVRNDIKKSTWHKTTDITYVMNIFIDVDAKKKDSDIPDKELKDYAATDEEYKAVWIAIDEINTWLESKGFKTGYSDKTGNGIRKLLPIPPIKITDSNREIVPLKIKAFLDQIREETGLTLDAVHDPRRITGTPTTLNKKLETDTRKNRIREPMNPIPVRDEDSQLKDYILQLEYNGNKSKSSTEQNTKNKDVSYWLSRDSKLNELYSGNIEGYDSKSEAELALYQKLLFYRYSDTEIDLIMRDSKIGKWANAKPSYRERTRLKANEYQTERISKDNKKNKDENDKPLTCIDCKHHKGELGEWSLCKIWEKRGVKSKSLDINNLEACEHFEKEEDFHEKIPPECIDLAMKLLNEGDPIDYIKKIWHRVHVGDENIGNVCCVAATTTMITNTKGLHLKPSGKSGKGKSDAIISFLHLLPKEKYIEGSLSGKSVFYMGDRLKKGTIIYSDDINLNEDVVATVKQTTTYYQTAYVHRTVNRNLEYRELPLPKRLCWFLTSVNGFDDDQMGNRFIGTDVNETTNQDNAVFEKQVEMAMLGVTDKTVDEAVLVCRAIFQILNQEEYHVEIPFIRSIVWTNKDNRRNFPMFTDIVKAVTVFKKFQREKHKGIYLSTIEDFQMAQEIYAGLEETNATNLTAEEAKLIKWLSILGTGAQDKNDIAEFLGTTNTKTRYLLHGRNSDGGLLLKIPGLKYSKDSVESDSGSRTNKNMYWYEGSLDFTAFNGIVSLDMDTIEESTEMFMNLCRGDDDVY